LRVVLAEGEGKSRRETQASDSRILVRCVSDRTVLPLPPN
jgi:hypothetical protein